jgi:hypothetical protein
MEVLRQCHENKKLIYKYWRCFIVNVYLVKSSLELMLYCFIMCRIKIKFSYLSAGKNKNKKNTTKYLKLVPT